MAGSKYKVMRVESSSWVPGYLSSTEIERAELKKADAELIEAECRSEDEIIKAAQDADALLVIFAQMTRRVFESLPKLKVVVRYGIGYDTVDVDAATDNNVIVVNIPDFCIEEVSDHAIALLLACARQVAWMDRETKRGRKWTELQVILTALPPPYKQTLGLVGCGNIGRMTAKKAQCLGFKTIGYDPYVDKAIAAASGIALVGLPELLRNSDYVSIHALLNKETRHLIGEKELRQMKPTAYLINTARGAVVDEQTLIKALDKKWLAGAALDVFEKEPIDPQNPLLKMDNVILTPHCAGSSSAALLRLKLSVAHEAMRVLTGKWPKSVVNKGVKPKVNLVRAD